MSPSNRPRSGNADLARLAAGFGRLPRGAQIAVAVVLLIALGAAAWFYRGGNVPTSVGQGTTPATQRSDSRSDSRPSAPPQSAAHSPHLLLGNPSDAIPDPARQDNYLVVHDAYALSWNDARGSANWVSWRIVRSDFGQAPREVEFLPDPLLPATFKQIGHRDYTGSGFDRGHLCPKGDRGGNRDWAASTFYTSNIFPQAANVNQKAWNNLENYTRDLVGQYRQRCYVVSGPAGKGGTGLNGYKTTVGDGKITVPAECWKIVVAIPDTGRATDNPSAITASARVIAVIMPNDQGKVGDDWATFRTTPAEIERRTGLTFFTALDPAVAETLRQKLDKETIPPPQPYRR